MPLSPAQLVTLPQAPGPRASTLWTDGSEGTLAYTGSGTGADWIVENNAAVARSGSYGLRIKSRTTDAADHDTVGALHSMTCPNHGIVEWSCWAYLVAKAPVSHWNFAIFPNLNSREYYAETLWYPNSGTFLYRNSVGGSVNIAALAGSWSAATWYFHRLVIDTINMHYVEVEFAGKKASLANIDIQNAWAGGADGCSPKHYLATTVSAPLEVYVDDSIVRRLRTNA